MSELSAILSKSKSPYPSDRPWHLDLVQSKVRRSDVKALPCSKTLYEHYLISDDATLNEVNYISACLSNDMISLAMLHKNFQVQPDEYFFSFALDVSITSNAADAFDWLINQLPSIMTQKQFFKILETGHSRIFEKFCQHPNAKIFLFPPDVEDNSMRMNEYIVSVYTKAATNGNSWLLLRQLKSIYNNHNKQRYWLDEAIQKTLNGFSSECLKILLDQSYEIESETKLLEYLQLAITNNRPCIVNYLLSIEKLRNYIIQQPNIILINEQDAKIKDVSILNALKQYGVQMKPNIDEIIKEKQKYSYLSRPNSLQAKFLKFSWFMLNVFFLLSNHTFFSFSEWMIFYDEIE